MRFETLGQQVRTFLVLFAAHIILQTLGYLGVEYVQSLGDSLSDVIIKISISGVIAMSLVVAPFLAVVAVISGLGLLLKIILTLAK